MIKFRLFSVFVMLQVGVCFSFDTPVNETFLKNVIEPQLRAHQESMDHQQKSFDQQKQVHQESFEYQPRVYKEAIDYQRKSFELQKQKHQESLEHQKRVHEELYALQLRLINLNFATEVIMHSNLSDQSLSIFLELRNMNEK